MQKSQDIHFDFSNKISLNFDGGEMSSYSGMTLIHEFCEKLGVKKSLQKHLPELREGVREYEKPEMLYQKLMRIIVGLASDNHAKFLEKDPVFQQIHNQSIASGSTCNRLEQSFSFDDAHGLQDVQKEILEYTFKHFLPKEVCLDLDTTYDPASENLYGSHFNGHYDTTGFSPLVCFDGMTGDFVKGMLRPGNHYCSRNIAKFLEPILKDYKRRGVLIKVRGDSGFACPEKYEVCEKYGAIYYTKLKNNALLKRKFEELLTDEIIRNRESVWSSFSYQAKSWKHPRRVLGRIQWNEGQLFPVCSAIVTNDEACTPEDGFQFYNGRAGIEGLIEEGKNGFSWDHLSHKSFEANATEFQLFLLAVQVVQLLRRLSLPNTKPPTGKNKRKSLPTIQTIRQRFIFIAGRLIHSARKLIFKCSSSFPFQDLFLRTLGNIQALPRPG